MYVAFGREFGGGLVVVKNGFETGSISRDEEEEIYVRRKSQSIALDVFVEVVLFVLVRRNCAMRTAPLAKVYGSVVVLVDVAEEAVQPRIGYRNSSSFKSSRQLGLVQLPTMVAVDSLEELPELGFGARAKAAELVVADLSIVVDVTGREHVLYKAIGIFEGYGRYSSVHVLPLRLVHMTTHGGSCSPSLASMPHSRDFPSFWCRAWPTESAGAPPCAPRTRHPCPPSAVLPAVHCGRRASCQWWAEADRIEGRVLPFQMLFPRAVMRVMASRNS